MIVEERMRTFINSLDTGNTPFLDELECSALSEGVPIIRKEMQSFIKTLLALAKPQKIKVSLKADKRFQYSSEL